jgi:hypothetical protein
MVLISVSDRIRIQVFCWNRIQVVAEFGSNSDPDQDYL